MRRVPTLVLAPFLLASALTSTATASRPMTVDDLLAVKAVSDPQVSPDGRRVVYVVTEIEREANKSNSSLWGLPVAGGMPRRLTTAPGVNNHPRWSPDGKTIAFVSNRGGSSQIWLLPVDGGEAHPLTKLPIDVAGPVWSPAGDKIAFAAEVYPGKTPVATAARDKEKDGAKSKVRVYDRLMVRHWSAWDEGKRSHLFVADAKTGQATDLTPGLGANTPPAPFGGSNDYVWSPDGKSLAFTVEPMKNAAWSTNTDIWSVPESGGTPKNLTSGNEGADAQPAFSPDGKALAYLSQNRAGFESDLWTLKVWNFEKGKLEFQSGAKRNAVLDQPVLSFVWMKHSAGTQVERPKNPNEIPAIKDENMPAGDLLAVVDEDGRERIELVSYTGHELAEGHVARRLVSDGTNTAVQPVPHAKEIVFVRSDAAHPAELFKATADGEHLTRLTHHNDRLVENLDLAKAEGFTFPGAEGDKVSGWLVKPPGFEPGKKYPVVFLIHGGPQGAWHDEWHARWNYQMFASPGFAVVAVNPRGSTGYGQSFTDEISRDWTGKVYIDLMKGLDHVLKEYPFLDGNRVAAAGGSYGGFMVNWIAGHTDRFKALISHAGVFDLTSKYGTTEELWFPEWEFGGPPWEQATHYREQSPSAFVANFKTPTLVTHGALDYRVPDAQGLGMFTSLQRRGVPSRYVFFPDEGHWIAKPANRAAWWGEMLGWLEKYLKK